MLRVMNAERLLAPMLPIFEHLPQAGALIRLQQWIHAVLAAREDSLRLVQIERTQIAKLIVHLSQDWCHLLRLLRLETQIPTQSIHRRSKRLASFVVAEHGVFYCAACEKAAGHYARDEDCNQRENNFPSS